jgi:Lamin Tail Domain
MIFINEWLPNPVGTDSKGEFIELYNTSNTSVNLDGWIIKTTGKKVFSLGGYSIAARGYLLLQRAETKISLKNTGETVSLYDANGKLADQSSFLGQAQEGKSLSRINYTTDPSEHFAWSDPTPGTANKISLNNSLAANSYPFNTPLNRTSLAASGGAIIGLALGLGVILGVLVVYCTKRDEKIEKLLFQSQP